MIIQVLGSGCPTCKKLHERVSQAVKELVDRNEIGAETTVEYVTDMQKIIDMHVMRTPVVAVDGVPVLQGMLPKVEFLKELIRKHATAPKEE